ncbi:hypothetical protein WJX84_008177 [Apatococcus fuscideae]|uniref:Uncharacterized protein n=1 Tax=Apatococcus fuscideae TaxID=2026836 RepID=A0AAW1SUI3_9CHLO
MCQDLRSGSRATQICWGRQARDTQGQDGKTVCPGTDPDRPEHRLLVKKQLKISSVTLLGIPSLGQSQSSPEIKRQSSLPISEQVIDRWIEDELLKEVPSLSQPQSSPEIKRESSLPISEQVIDRWIEVELLKEVPSLSQPQSSPEIKRESSLPISEQVINRWTEDELLKEVISEHSMNRIGCNEDKCFMETSDAIPQRRRQIVLFFVVIIASVMLGLMLDFF